MKILFIVPPTNYIIRHRCHPIGVLYLASYLKKRLDNNPIIRILDCMAMRISLRETMKTFYEFSPDIVCFSFITPQADFAYVLSKEIKTKSNAIVIHGGIHATVLPEETLENGADFCVVGEGERALLKLIQRLVNKKGNLRSEHNRIIRGALIEDLDDLPFIDWSLINLDIYNDSIHVNKEQAFPIHSSRGCPFNCAFCGSERIWNRRIRYRSPNNVIREIQTIKAKYGTKNYHFYNEDMLTNGKHMLAIAEGLIKTRLNINWVGLARTDSIIRNSEFLPLLKKSGCVGFEIGIESGDEHVLKKMRKYQNRNSIEKCLDIIAKNDFSYVRHLLMSFYPGETVQGHVSQRKFYKRIGIGRDEFFECTAFASPFPGTEFAKVAKMEGIVIPNYWKDYHIGKINFLPNSFLDSPLSGFKFDLSMQKKQEIIKVLRGRVFKFKCMLLMKTVGIEQIVSEFMNLLSECSTVRNVGDRLRQRYFPDKNDALTIACFLTTISIQLDIVIKD